MRERVSEIEQFWSPSDEENTFEKPSPYLTAFILSSEQLVLCQRMQFHAGLISYVLLHIIEASSGLLQENQIDGQDRIHESEFAILDAMKLWCTKIDFPDELKYAGDSLSSELIQSQISVNDILRYWLRDVTKMAAYYGKIAYGTLSDESTIFNNILDIWSTTRCGHEENEDLVVDFEEKHKMTCQNISFLC